MAANSPDPGSLTWRDPPDALALSHEEVHVWRASLDEPGIPFEKLWELLAQDERDRATRFRFAHDRQRYIAGRGLLRAILGRYSGIAPRELVFGYGARGKPYLVEAGVESTLRFNLAHSQHLALYAVARGREVGVDIEQLRGDMEIDAITERCFSPREIAALRALPEALRHPAFFHVWTRKEALIKAWGDGLSLALDQFDVSLASPLPPSSSFSASSALSAVKPSVVGGRRWSLWELDAGPGFAAALGVEGDGWRLRCWNRMGSDRSILAPKGELAEPQ